MTRQFFLKNGTYSCAIGETRIVLDTVQDKYFFFAGHQATWFAELVGTCEPGSISSDAITFGERLCDRGILTNRSDAGHAMSESSTPRTLENLPVIDKAPIRLRDIFTFAAGFAHLRRLQDPKQRNLRHILAAVQSWKQAARRRPTIANCDVPALVHTFHALSPWFFSVHDACFFRSVLLIHFLARYGVEADWTFAVRVSPFRAHCWVTFCGVLLNDDPDSAVSFQPILTV